MAEIKEIYSNNWTGELCIPDDLGIAPPEKYLKVIRLDAEDVYVEKWDCGGGVFSEIEFCADKYWEKGFPTAKRTEKEERWGIKLRNMVEWSVPASVFDEWVKKYKLGD